MTTKTEPKAKAKPKSEFAVRTLVTQSREPTMDEIKQHMLDNPGCKGPQSARITMLNRVEKLQYLANGEWVDAETVVVIRE